MGSAVAAAVRTVPTWLVNNAELREEEEEEEEKEEGICRRCCFDGKLDYFSEPRN